MNFATNENVPPISYGLYALIRTCVPKGSCLLELGSGDGSTIDLKNDYDLYSVEHNSYYVGKYNEASKYILASMKDGFYDLENVQLPDYSAVLMDGPDTDNRTEKLLENLQYFNPKVHWFFDDLRHARIGSGIKAIAEKTGRTLLRFEMEPKWFAVLLGEGK